MSSSDATSGSAAATAVWQKHYPVLCQTHVALDWLATANYTKAKIIKTLRKALKFDEMSVEEAVLLNQAAWSQFKESRANSEFMVFDNHTYKNCPGVIDQLTWLIALTCGRAIKGGASRHQLKTYHSYDIDPDERKIRLNEFFAKTVFSAFNPSKSVVENEKAIKKSIQFDKSTNIEQLERNSLRHLVEVCYLIDAGSYLPLDDEEQNSAMLQNLSDTPFQLEAVHMVMDLVKSNLRERMKNLTKSDSTNEPRSFTRWHEFRKRLEAEQYPNTSEQPFASSAIRDIGGGDNGSKKSSEEPSTAAPNTTGDGLIEVDDGTKLRLDALERARLQLEAVRIEVGKITGSGQ